MMEMVPFQDARGEWWMYRHDDPLMHTPLGPFFTKQYAQEQVAYVIRIKTPMPSSLAHRLPKHPLRYG